MSDIIKNVTIALKLRPDAPPDVAQYTQGVRQYYAEVLTNAANATTANNLLSESYKRITSELSAATQAGIQFNQATGGIAQYYASVIAQSDEAAKAIRTLSAEYNALQGIGAKLQPPSIMAPNGFPTGGGLDPGFIGGSGGGNIGFTPSTDGVQSLDAAAEATKKYADEIDRLISSGMNFSTVEDAVRKFAEATMDALNVVDPTQRMMGIETIMEDARKHVEKFQEVDTTTTQKMSRNWQAAQQSMTSAVSAASRLVSAVGFLTGSSDDVEELAKRFANVRMSIEAMSASSSMFNNTSEGLQRMGAASQAAQAQLAMLGGSAGFTTRILAGVGPAATAMQAALGPISLVITGIGLAFTVAQTAAAVWGEKSTESAENSEEALKGYEDQLRSISRELDVQVQLIDNQTRATMLLYETRKLASGGSLSLEQALATGQDMAVTAQANEKASLQAALAKAKEALPEAIKLERSGLERDIARRESLVKEKEAELLEYSRKTGTPLSQLIEGQKQLARAESLTAADSDAIAPWNGLALQKEKLRKLDRQQGIIDLEQTIASGDPAKMAEGLKALEKTFPEAVNVLQKAALDAMQGRQAAPKFVIDETNQLIREEIQRAKGEGVDIGKGPDGKYMLDADREIEKARKAFEAERMVAQNLMADPAKFADLQFGVNTAQNPLMALQGISQFIPDDQEQALRGDGNLTKAKVQAALSDAAEFESERVAMDEEIARMNERVVYYQQAMRKLLDVVEAQQGQLDKNANQIEQIQRATR